MKWALTLERSVTRRASCAAGVDWCRQCKQCAAPDGEAERALNHSAKWTAQDTQAHV